MPILIAALGGYIYGAFIDDDGISWTKAALIVGVGVYAYTAFFKGGSA